MIFDAGISDDNGVASDEIPGFIFFERGVNSDANVQLTAGGTLDAPILSPNSIDVLRGSLWASGVSIAMIEISPNSQELGVAGLDLSDFFGAEPVAPTYGVRVTSIRAVSQYSWAIAAARPGPNGLLSPGERSLLSLKLL